VGGRRGHLRVGCAFSDKVVYPEYFQQNPDDRNPAYRTRLGVYKEGCGLDKVHLSWGHDEYIYNIVKDHLPEEGLYMLRYHSFYAAHRERAYEYLNERSRQADVRVGAPVQPLRSLFEESRFLPILWRFDPTTCADREISAGQTQALIGADVANRAGASRKSSPFRLLA